MSLNKTIISLQKQNDGIYSSLVSKGIQFERIEIPKDISEDSHIDMLKQENTKLKEISNANKPPPQIKEEKKKPISSTQSQQKKEKEIEKEKNNNCDDCDDCDDCEETFEEPKKKFETIINMEELKRAFFNRDYETFETEISSHPFKFYKVEYKYNSDKDGDAVFSAKNLLKGFVRNFDDYRKYFMICFRCWKHQTDIKYKYQSLWIVNTNEPIANIIGSIEDDFIFDEITEINEFVSNIKKLPIEQIEADEPVYIDGYTCIGETYVH